VLVAAMNLSLGVHEAMQQRFLADVTPQPDDAGLRPGAPVGMRELEALLDEP
jgi:hypothetical protein